jgi:Fe-S cluster assembly ATP-binding protein
MGHPNYDVLSGDIVLDGESIMDMEPHERAKSGLFLAFQHIPEIKGVKLFEFLRTIYNAKNDTDLRFVAFKKHILPLMDELAIDHEFLWRDLNVGFSGGERRKIEILQLKLLNPRYIILDEVDSGLDVDAFRSVASLLSSLDSADNSIIIITHYFSILDHIPVDHVSVMQSGKLIKEGDATLANVIQAQGFEGVDSE